MLKYIKIDKKALIENVLKIKGWLKDEIGLMAIVKSNAYGHGAVEVGRLIADQVSFLGVDDFFEAEELRIAGISKPILILGAVEPDYLEEVNRLDISVPIYSEESLRALIKTNLKIKVHLKVDTGMHRLGIKPGQATSFAKKIVKSNLVFEGLWSHFADSGDKQSDSYSKKQINNFKKVVKKLSKLNPKYIHLSNSSAIVRFPEAHFNLVRSGMMIYGFLPSEASTDLNLKPVLEFKSKIIQIRNLNKGQFIGYGLTYRLKKRSKIAVVPVGYKDGYARSLSNKGQVLVGGQRCKVVGRICMRMMMIDVSGLTNVKPGQEVALIGSQLSGRIDADELGEQIGTTKYEILSRLDKQITRIYE
jgi:alanine racemase